MNWTDERPEREGYYWLKNYYRPGHNSIHYEPVIVLVLNETEGDLVLFEDYDEELEDVKGEWYGPLVPPLE